MILNTDTLNTVSVIPLYAKCRILVRFCRHAFTSATAGGIVMAKSGSDLDLCRSN